MPNNFFRNNNESQEKLVQFWHGFGCIVTVANIFSFVGFVSLVHDVDNIGELFAHLLHAVHEVAMVSEVILVTVCWLCCLSSHWRVGGIASNGVGCIDGCQRCCRKGLIVRIVGKIDKIEVAKVKAE